MGTSQAGLARVFSLSRVLVFVIGLAVGLTAMTSAASVVVRLSADDLVRLSKRIVVAKVVHKESRWGPGGRRIFTHHRLRVQDDLLGPGEAEITIVVPGGVVGDIAQRTFGQATLTVGDQRLFFLSRTDKDFYVVGMSQGVFDLRTTDKGVAFVQRLEGLTMLGHDTTPLVLTRPEVTARIRVRAQDAP